jgi:ribonuclease P protein component
MIRQFKLGKNERLKSRKQIEQLFREGLNFSLAPFRIYYIFCPRLSVEPARIQFGVGVSGKVFKKAVDRNRLKRLTREAYRLQKNALHERLQANNQQLNLFFIYTAKELTDFNNVLEKVKLILDRLIKITDENAIANS